MERIRKIGEIILRILGNPATFVVCAVGLLAVGVLIFAIGKAIQECRVVSVIRRDK